jgi:hypothetical protein
MQPVHADYVGNGEFTSNGIAFEDYARMTTQTHKLAAYRQGAPPDWVFDNNKLRAVIVGCVEARADQWWARRSYSGTDAERLARAQKTLAAKLPNLEARIDELCKQFLAAKNAGDAALKKHFQQKIEEVDTQLRMIENPAKFYVGAAFYYWRAGLDSVATGQQLGIKPPHVRCILWRMGKVAGQLGYGPPKNKQHNLGGAEKRRRKKQQHVKDTPTEELLAVAKAVIEKERRQQIAAAHKGKKRPPMSQAWKDNLSAAHKGKTLSAEHRRKISAAQKDRVMPKETRRKIAQAVNAAHVRRGTKLIPQADRLPLVVKMYGEGATTGAIAQALGWSKGNGYGMVKRLAIQARLR